MLDRVKYYLLKWQIQFCMVIDCFRIINELQRNAWLNSGMTQSWSDLVIKRRYWWYRSLRTWDYRYGYKRLQRSTIVNHYPFFVSVRETSTHLPFVFLHTSSVMMLSQYVFNFVWYFIILNNIIIFIAAVKTLLDIPHWPSVASVGAIWTTTAVTRST